MKKSELIRLAMVAVIECNLFNGAEKLNVVEALQECRYSAELCEKYEEGKKGEFEDE